MRQFHNRLTASSVKKQDAPGLYCDGLGLYLQVSYFGTKSWLFRYQRNGKARKMGLGPVHTVSLKLARQKAKYARIKLDAGIDPIDDRKRAKPGFINPV